MRPEPHPAKSYLQQYIVTLVSACGTPGIDEDLLHDVSYYVHKRLSSNLGDAEICSLLAEAIWKLRKHLNRSGAVVDSAPRYFREIVKNLALDRIREEGGSARFIISAEAITALSNSGLPVEILQHFERLISAESMAYRTFQDKFHSTCSSKGYAKKAVDLYRRIAMDAFRVNLYAGDRSIEELPLPAEDSREHQSIETEALQGCLAGLKQRDRDLIKLRFGIAGRVDGFQFSFEEMMEIFGFSSVRQTQNRFYYLLKALKECLSSKGFRR